MQVWAKPVRILCLLFSETHSVVLLLALTSSGELSAPKNLLFFQVELTNATVLVATSLRPS